MCLVKAKTKTTYKFVQLKHYVQRTSTYVCCYTLRKKMEECVHMGITPEWKGA
jgi:hypothetical protein